MTYISSLQNIHKHGTFGDYENKNENELLKLKEVKNLIIYQRKYLIGVDGERMTNLEH